MAKRGREAAAKRAREARRQQQKVDKQERREAAAAVQTEEVAHEDQTALMEEFATLSKDFEANVVSAAQYAEEKHRIFVALGIESEEDAP